ncbi:MAG: thioredoxin [Chitinophagales bacterium]|nr:thioredoxin [Chitinophagales bacterium]
MDFKTNVLEKSYEKPVVVDFWAPWCGPCRMLGPTIEKLAEEQAKKWDLVKLNTEEEQELAAQYGISSIPNVKMFHKGEVIAEFAGALSRTMIIEWLEEHLPDERKEGLATLLENLESEESVSLLENFVVEHPDVKEARLALAKIVVYEEADKAIELVAPIRIGDKLEGEATNIRTIAELLNFRPENEQGVAALLSHAQKALKNKKEEIAIQYIIEAATLDKAYSNDLPRRIAIALFNTMGPQHPLTKNYRWKFDMVLY